MRKPSLNEVFVTASLFGLLVAIGWTIRSSPEPSSAFFEVLRIFTSPQVVIGLIVVIVIWRFPLQFEGLVDRVKRVGPVEMQDPEATPNLIPSARNWEQEKVQLEATVKEAMTDLERRNETIDVANRVIDLLADEFIECAEETKFWHFKYLSVFLVPMSLDMLDWLRIGPGTEPRVLAPSLFRQQWQLSRGVGIGVIDTILDVLLKNRLVTLENEALTLTKHGEEFLHFLQENKLYRGVLG